MEGEFGNEVGHEAVQGGDVPARFEDLGSLHRLTVGSVTGRTPGQRLPADHVFQHHSGRQRDLRIGCAAQVVSDFAGCPVTPAQNLPADHDGRRQAGTEIDVDGRVVTGQRPPARFCLGRRLRVSGHPDRCPGEGVPQLAAKRKLAPALDRRGEFYPVVEWDPEGGYAHGRQLTAGGGRCEKVTGRLYAALEAGARAALAAAGDRRRRKLLTIRRAHGHGDFGAAEVEAEYDRWVSHRRPFPGTLMDPLAQSCYHSIAPTRRPHIRWPTPPGWPGRWMST